MVSILYSIFGGGGGVTSITFLTFSLKGIGLKREKNLHFIRHKQFICLQFLQKSVALFYTI